MGGGRLLLASDVFVIQFLSDKCHSEPIIRRYFLAYLARAILNFLAPATIILPYKTRDTQCLADFHISSTALALAVEMPRRLSLLSSVP